MLDFQTSHMIRSLTTMPQASSSIDGRKRKKIGKTHQKHTV
jgi:hypothetical protein